MTKEEAYRLAMRACEETWNEKTCKQIKEALEQEPILDKIRSEIEQVAYKQFQIAMGVEDLNKRYTHIQMEIAYRHSLNIIDKYKAESEG